MKILFNISVIAIILSSCGGSGNSLSDKKKELDALKTESKTLLEKIKTLELEIAKLDTGQKTDERAEVRTTDIVLSDFKTFIEVQGRVDADENVALSTQIPGVITRINVKAGDNVQKGQVLAETDASAIQQQIMDLETNLELARQLYQKQQNLWKQNIGTEIQLLQAKTNKESLEKKMNALNEQLRMSKIISPINGTVDAINIKVAQMVAPGMGAINVVNYNNLKVKAELAESYSARIGTGNDVIIYFPDINDSISGKIHYASRAINQLSRTFSVEVILGNGKKYHPNMVAKLKINDYKSVKPQIIVPVKFIQKGINESYVLIYENGAAVKRILTISKEYNGLAEISSGLAAGDKLITEGYDLINEGDKIRLKD